MTPVETITAAAKKIRALAETAQHDLETADYWKPYTSNAWAHGLINGFGGPSSDYAAVLPPTVGTALADCLVEEARRVSCASSPAGQAIVGRRALAVARAILGTPDGQP